MKMIYVISVLIGLMSTNGALANEVRNGGDAVVCYDAEQRITSVEILDLYEMKAFHKWQPNLGQPSLSVEAKLQIVFSRLKRISPVRAEQYSERFGNFFQEAEITDLDLDNILDSYHIGVPNGCKLMQIAAARKPDSPQQKRYFINQRLWDKLNNENKAILILHEIAYREAKLYEAQNSVGARHLVGLLASGKIDELNFESFVKTLQKLKYGATDQEGFELSLFEPVPEQAWLDGCKDGVRRMDFQRPIWIKQDEYHLEVANCPTGDTYVRTPWGYVAINFWRRGCGGGKCESQVHRTSLERRGWVRHAGSFTINNYRMGGAFVQGRWVDLGRWRGLGYIEYSGLNLINGVFMEVRSTEHGVVLTTSAGSPACFSGGVWEFDDKGLVSWGPVPFQTPIEKCKYRAAVPRFEDLPPSEEENW